jgi:hypothetical protein
MNWQELSDRKLVELCLEYDKDAYIELERRYKRMIARTAAKTLIAANLPGLRPAVALLADLSQDTWTRIIDDDMRALRELQWLHEGALRGLLQIAATTATQDYIRKRLSNKRDITKEESLTDIGMFLPQRGNTVASLEHKILLDQLAKCLEKVIGSEADWIRDVTIFRLFFGYRITASDLARVYRMNVRKVENTLVRLARMAKAHCL